MSVHIDLDVINTDGWTRAHIALLVVQPTNSGPRYLNHLTYPTHPHFEPCVSAASHLICTDG